MKEEQASPGTRNVQIHKVTGRDVNAVGDLVVTEEPLEMRIGYGPANNRRSYTLAITMRTPGNDDDLIRGFLYTEGIVTKATQILNTSQEDFGLEGYQAITAELSPDLEFNPELNQRHFYTTSSCGVCGKASIDMVRQVTSFRLKPETPVITGDNLSEMLHAMRSGQPLFTRTGGIHAAALFDVNDRMLALREDVGRHNAVDKLIGALGKLGSFPLDDHVMVVSGRGGFELVQKAVMSGVAIFASVGAPSSLAIELARASNMTLIGFLKPGSYNVYSCEQRIQIK